MKKNFLFHLFSFTLSLGYGQQGKDTVVLHHQYYTSIFVQSQHIPALVEYFVEDNMLICDEHLKRGKFAKDPDLPESSDLDNDYKGNHFDRGHNMSAKDNDCDETGMKECFYFSNMFPQTHKLNAGSWYKLEKIERDSAKEHHQIKVFIGSIGKIRDIGKKHKITVPAFCWKVIYFLDTKKYECYIFPNNEEAQKNPKEYIVSLSEIEKKVKIKFREDKVKIGTIEQYKQ